MRNVTVYGIILLCSLYPCFGQDLALPDWTSRKDAPFMILMPKKDLKSVDETAIHCRVEGFTGMARGITVEDNRVMIEEFTLDPPAGTSWGKDPDTESDRPPGPVFAKLLISEKGLVAPVRSNCYGRVLTDPFGREKKNGMVPLDWGEMDIGFEGLILSGSTLIVASATFRFISDYYFILGILDGIIFDPSWKSRKGANTVALEYISDYDEHNTLCFESGSAFLESDGNTLPELRIYDIKQIPWNIDETGTVPSGFPVADELIISFDGQIMLKEGSLGKTVKSKTVEYEAEFTTEAKDPAGLGYVGSGKFKLFSPAWLTKSFDVKGGFSSANASGANFSATLAEEQSVDIAYGGWIFNSKGGIFRNRGKPFYVPYYTTTKAGPYTVFIYSAAFDSKGLPSIPFTGKAQRDEYEGHTGYRNIETLDINSITPEKVIGSLKIPVNILGTEIIISFPVASLTPNGDLSAPFTAGPFHSSNAAARAYLYKLYGCQIRENKLLVDSLEIIHRTKPDFENILIQNLIFSLTGQPIEAEHVSCFYIDGNLMKPATIFFDNDCIRLYGNLEITKIGQSLFSHEIEVESFTLDNSFSYHASAGFPANNPLFFPVAGNGLGIRAKHFTIQSDEKGTNYEINGSIGASPGKKALKSSRFFIKTEKTKNIIFLRRALRITHIPMAEKTSSSLRYHRPPP